MEPISISADKLRQVKLFVCCPMYGGMNSGLFMKSCLDLQTLSMKYGMDVKFSFLFNESLITRARNYLVDEFLRANYTHLLFIDSDIHFNPEHVLTLIALDKDVAGGPYPKKSIKWKSIWMAAKKHLQNPNFDESKFNPAELEQVAGDYVFNPVPGTVKFNVQMPLEVMEIGTGFMMVKRHVFDKFKTEYPHLSYKPDHVGQDNFDGSRYIHAYFDTVIDPDSHRYLSEDYMFCVPHNSKIETENGFMKVSDIVESKYSGKVRTLDSKGKLSWNNVIGWSKNRNVDKTWIKLIPSNKNNRNSILTCTTDHRVMCFDDVFDPQLKYLPAIDTLGKYVVRKIQRTENPLYSKEQLSFLLGSLLGDGTISKSGQIMFTHGKSQHAYNELKSTLFNGKLSNSTNRGFGKDKECSVVHTPVNAQTNELRKLLYVDGKKTIKNVISMLDEKSLAFLYMDDGSLDVGTSGIHTEGFSDEDQNLLIVSLAKFGLNPKLGKHIVSYKGEKREYSKLIFNTEQTKILHSLIAKYIPEYMEYKLIPEFRGGDKFDYGSVSLLEYSAHKIVKVDDSIDQKKYRYLFDIEVENDHNFFANGSLVHNCQYWRAIGGKVWLCPWMELGHIGTYEFKGNLPAIASQTGVL